MNLNTVSKVTNWQSQNLNTYNYIVGLEFMCTILAFVLLINTFVQRNYSVTKCYGSAARRTEHVNTYE